MTQTNASQPPQPPRQAGTPAPAAAPAPIAEPAISLSEQEMVGLLMNDGDAGNAGAGAGAGDGAGADGKAGAGTPGDASNGSGEAAGKAAGAGDAGAGAGAGTGAEGISAEDLATARDELRAAAQTLAEAAEKVQAGGELTKKEERQVAEAKRTIDTLQEALGSEKGLDLWEHGSTLARALIEQDQEHGATKRELLDTQKRLAALEQRIGRADEQALWGQLETKYAGVNVQSVWDQSLKDAEDLVGADNPAVDRVANKFFHERAGAASKRQHPPAPPAAAGRTVKAAPTPVTPDGGRVTAATGVVTAPAAAGDPDAAYLHDVLALVR